MRDANKVGEPHLARKFEAKSILPLGRMVPAILHPFPLLIVIEMFRGFNPSEVWPGIIVKWFAGFIVLLLICTFRFLVWRGFDSTKPGKTPIMVDMNTFAIAHFPLWLPIWIVMIPAISSQSTSDKLSFAFFMIFFSALIFTPWVFIRLRKQPAGVTRTMPPV